MACSNITLSGIASAACAPNLSGVKEIALAVADHALFDTSTGFGDVVKDLDLDDWKEYKAAKHTGAMTVNLTKDESTGVLYYVTEVTAQFNGLDQAKSDELEKAAVQQNLYVSLIDGNNKCWGFENATITAISGQTGAGMDDGNFYTITITAYSSHMPYQSTVTPWHKQGKS